MEHRPKVTPKDFFLWAGAMIALYASVFSFLALVFNYINYAFPDALDYIPSNPYQGGVSYEMASLIVLFPIFLILMYAIHRGIARDPSRREIWVRRWALYLTLFLAGVTLAADLITVIMYFLNGELSMRFFLKAALVLLVAGAGFLHFTAELWGYWEEKDNRMRARVIAWGTAAVVVLTIGAGFLVIGTPAQARGYQFDEQKVSDLQTIQSDVVTYWQEKSALPATLDELNDPLAGVTVPVDPQSGDAYQYQIVSTLAFKLCANFNAPTAANAITPEELSTPVALTAEGGPQDLSDSWYHGAGNACFTRTIDPSRYPKLQTQ